jgi:hypothetical protein
MKVPRKSPPIVRRRSYRLLTAGSVLVCAVGSVVSAAQAVSFGGVEPRVLRPAAKRLHDPSASTPATPARHVSTRFFSRTPRSLFPPGVAAGAATGTLPTRLADFPGPGFDGLVPPNPVIAAGPADLLTVTNGRIMIFSKDGDLRFEDTLTGFFEPVAEADDFLTDPRTFFDAGRFFIGLVSRRQDPFAAFFLLAVSASSDPLGEWRYYAFDAARDNAAQTTNFADLPSLGSDANAIYFTANMFDSRDLSFRGAKIRVIPKEPLLAGAETGFFDFSDLRVNEERVFHLQAAQSLSPTLAAFIVNTRFPDTCEVNVWRVSNPPNAPPFLARADLRVGGSCTTAPGAPQRDSDERIETGGTRIINSVWRNGSLWAALTVGHDWGSGVVGSARVFQIRTRSFPAVSLVQDFLQGSDGAHGYYPVVAVDAADNLLLGFNHSSPSDYVSIRFAGQSADDGGTLPLSTAVLQAGRASYVLTDSTGRNRWGDYNGASVDPEDNSLWLIGEYAEAPADRWGTWIGHFAFPGALFTPTRTPSATPTARPTRTPSRPTRTATQTPRPSRTPTPSPSPTSSPTATRTPTSPPKATHTKTSTPGATPTPTLPRADVNRDGRVDGTDVDVVTAALFGAKSGFDSDVNDDARVSCADIVAVVRELRGPAPTR